MYNEFIVEWIVAAGNVKLPFYTTQVDIVRKIKKASQILQSQQLNFCYVFVLMLNIKHGRRMQSFRRAQSQILEVIFRDNFIATFKKFLLFHLYYRSVITLLNSSHLMTICLLSWCGLPFQNTISKCIASMRSHYQETREFPYFKADKLWENYAPKLIQDNN